MPAAGMTAMEVAAVRMLLMEVSAIEMLPVAVVGMMPVAVVGMVPVTVVGMMPVTVVGGADGRIHKIFNTEKAARMTGAGFGGDGASHQNGGSGGDRGEEDFHKDKGMLMED